MNCENIRELLAGYVLEALDADERDAVERHLEHCAEGSDLVAALTATAHELPTVLDALAAPDAPPSIPERLTPPPAPPHPPLWRRRVRFRIAAAAMVALA